MLRFNRANPPYRVSRYPAGRERPHATMGAISMLRRPSAETTLVCAVVCLAAATSLTSQQVFRGRVDLVRVDVSVIDNRTGKPVTDLKREDFTVTENGTPQRIDAFVLNQ